MGHGTLSLLVQFGKSSDIVHANVQYVPIVRHNMLSSFDVNFGTSIVVNAYNGFILFRRLRMKIPLLLVSDHLYRILARLKSIDTSRSSEEVNINKDIEKKFNLNENFLRKMKLSVITSSKNFNNDRRKTEILSERLTPN